MTISYPRFTPTERRKLTMSARARESFRTVGIRGGAGPGEGAPPTPPTGDPSYYDLSDDDRALIEGVINDANSSDPARRAAAFTWWNRAITQVSKGIPGVYPFFSGSPSLFERVLDWWGFRTYQNFNVIDSGCQGDSAAGVVTHASLTQGVGDQVHVDYKTAFAPTKWECVNSTDPVSGNPAVRFHNDGINVRIRDEPFSDLSVIHNHGSSTFYVEGTVADFGGTVFCTPPDDALAASGGGAGEYGDSLDTSLLAANSCIVVEIGILTGWACSQKVCRGEDLSFPPYEPSGAFSIAPVDAPADAFLNPCDLVDQLRDYPYAPPPGTPPGTPPPIDTPPVDTPPVDTPPVDGPPTQPPDPGTNPFPGQPPVDVPTDGECFIDATTISPAAVDALTSGIEGAWTARTNDNAERLYAPQGSDGCRDFDPVDEADMVSALVAEGWTTSAQSGGVGGCSVDATTISQAAVDALTSGRTNPWTSDPNDNQERLYAPAGTNGARKFDPIDERYKIDALQAEGWMFYEDGSGLPPASWCSGSGGSSGGLTHICPPASWCASAVPPEVPPGVPVPPTVPPGPLPPTGPPGTEPIDTGIQDPGAGGCMTLASKPSGFNDPSQAGGIARQFQPGQPMVIDYGAGSLCQAKIVKVTPNVGTDGGPEICVGGGIDNGGKTTEKTCYGPGLVTDAIQSVLGDMVAEGGSIIFDSDSTRELHRPLCFRAGTSKRVILNQLLDMVGFCVFPMFDCNVIVGYCGPVNVVWTYHEDVDLIKFDLEYDGQEIFDYVEVFRGDFVSRAGNVFVPGNSVLYPVGSPASSVSGDRIYQYEVPYGTPDSELNSIAITLAARLRSQALPEIAFGVPLNSMLALRHQLRIQMPSVGFDAYYMVTRLARDYNRENGHLSTGQARWLRAA